MEQTEKEDYNLEELEAIITEYRNKVAFARNHPAFHSTPVMQQAVAEIEEVIAELEEQAASMLSSELLHEMETEQTQEGQEEANEDIRNSLIKTLLEGQPNQAELIRMAIDIRSIEYIHGSYDPANWSAIAHLLPPLG